MIQPISTLYHPQVKGFLNTEHSEHTAFDISTDTQDYLWTKSNHFEWTRWTRMQVMFLGYCQPCMAGLVLPRSQIWEKTVSYGHSFLSWALFRLKTHIGSWTELNSWYGHISIVQHPNQDLWYLHYSRTMPCLLVGKPLSPGSRNLIWFLAWTKHWFYFIAKQCLCWKQSQLLYQFQY